MIADARYAGCFDLLQKPRAKKTRQRRNAVQLALSGIFVFVQVVVNIIKSC